MRRRRAPLGGHLPLPQHPYRDAAVVNGILAILLLLTAWLTGGQLGRALVFGIGYFVIATVWSWWRFRARIAEEAAAKLKPSDPDRNGGTG